MISLLQNIRSRCYYSSTPSVTSNREKRQDADRFETVFSFPFVKYFAVFNRLKVYHLAGTGVLLPTSGLLEILNAVPGGTFATTAYIGVTAAAVLSVTSLPFQNIIGFIYISEDNRKIKISSVNYWGNRIDKLIPAENWVPLFDMKPKVMDAVYLTPRLTDGTTYKLFIKFGKIVNPNKMGSVLD